MPYSFLPTPDYIIGENCDLMLVHPDINDGDPVGFVLTPTPTHKGSSFSIQRETTLDGSIHIFMFFTLIMSDDLKDPDGKKHPDSRQEMYDWLLEFLTADDTFGVITVLGCYPGIGPLGHSATELHLVNGSYINVKLANITAYHGPVDPEFFLASIWHDTPPPVDALTWESSLWR